MTYNPLHDSFRRAVRRIVVVNQMYGRELTRDRLREEALAKTPEAFYVSYDRAAQVIGPLLGKDYKGPVGTPRRQFWLDMAAMVREQMEAPKCLTFPKALSFVLNFRAPTRYYLSRRTADRLIAQEVVMKTIIIPKKQ